MTPNQTAASAAPPASLPTPPASVAVSNNSWSISSEDDLPKEDSDDETKDQSYGVGAKYKKSPTKGRGKKIATPQRNHEVSKELISHYSVFRLFVFKKPKEIGSVEILFSWKIKTNLEFLFFRHKSGINSDEDIVLQ